MRRDDKEIKDQEIINEIFKGSTVCRIAIFDDNYPYIVPMNYGYCDNTLYFHSAPEGKKFELLNKNPNVSFEIEDSYQLVKGEIPCKWTSRFRSLLGQGVVEFITDIDEKKKAFDVIMEQHGKTTENQYKPKVLEWIAMFKIDIKSVTGKVSTR